MPLAEQNSPHPRAAKSFRDPVETKPKKNNTIILPLTLRFLFDMFYAQNNTIPSKMTRSCAFPPQNLDFSRPGGVGGVVLACCLEE